MICSNYYVNSLLDSLRDLEESRTHESLEKLFRRYLKKLPGEILLVNDKFEYYSRCQLYVPVSTASVVQLQRELNNDKENMLIDKISEMEEKVEFGNYLVQKFNELSCYELKLIFQYRILNRNSIRKTMELAGFSQYLVQRYTRMALEELDEIFSIS